MTKLNDVYKCSVCGNIVTVVVLGGGVLACCDKEMELLEEKTTAEEGVEKHVPVIEKSENGVLVKVGSVPHPMEENHFIALVQLMKDGKVLEGKRLYPGESPEVEFCCVASPEGLSARELCNVHGVWKTS